MKARTKAALLKPQIAAATGKLISLLKKAVGSRSIVARIVLAFLAFYKSLAFFTCARVRLRTRALHACQLQRRMPSLGACGLAHPGGQAKRQALSSPLAGAPAFGDGSPL